MKKTNFAYIGKGGILHYSSSIDTAIEYAIKGTKVVPTELETANGHFAYNGEGVIVYSETDMKLDAHGGKIKVVSELVQLYSECRNGVENLI